MTMGSPLSPLTTNYFMEYFEEMALETATHKPLCWFRYVDDDTFVIWPHGPGKLAEFLDHLNGVHENIKFTMETERDGHLSFLDIDNTVNPMAHWAIVCRKLPHTPTSISMPTHTTTLLTNRLFPTLVRRPEPADPTDSRSIEGSRYHPGEAHFGRPSSLCQHDFRQPDHWTPT
jgi:hypothetical protein